MKKLLMAAGIAGALFAASNASAATYVYTNSNSSASDGGTASVNISQYIQDNSGSHTQVWIDGKQIVGDSAPQPPLPPIPTPTPPNNIDSITSSLNQAVQANRARIEQNLRSASQSAANATEQESRIEQHVQTVNGSTTGQIHVFRRENGQVVEDRTIPIHSNSVTVSNPPVLPTPTLGTNTNDSLIHSLSADGSSSIVLRAVASSTGLPWLANMPFFFPPFPFNGSSTDDNVLFPFDAQPSPFVSFLNSLFSLFR